MPLLTARTSTIFISTEEGTKVYSSTADIPVAVRKRLERITETQTLLIADRRGREEVLRAAAGGPSSIQLQAYRRFSDKLRDDNAVAAPSKAQATFARKVRLCLEYLVPVAVGTSLWLLLDINF
jgi:hypothetical protein